MIRTPDCRVRVFVSSTMAELAAERSAVRDAYLDQSDIFLGIYGLATAALATGRPERARALWASVRHLLADSPAATLGGGPVYLPRYQAALDGAFPATPPGAGLDDAVARALRDD